MSDCVFCEIIAGKRFARLLESNAMAVVILDRNQTARGHMLVIPRSHVINWHELTDDDAAQMGRLARKWAGALTRAFAPDGYNILVNNGEAAGQDVFHVHLHITPRTANDGYYSFGGRHKTVTEEDSATIASRLLES
jgi:histidine triad (HIT) family protein